LFAQEWFISPLLLTLKVAFATLLLHSTLGVLLAAVISGQKRFYKTAIDIFISLPIVFPPIAVGFFLLLLLGKKGLIGSALAAYNIEIIFSTSGVILAAFIAGLPLVVKPIESALSEQEKLYAEAAYCMGKSRFETLIFALLPNIPKAICAALFLGLGRSFGEIGITLMLGGNIIGETDTLGLAIYNGAMTGETDKAIVLSAALGVFSLLIFIVLKRLSYGKDQ
jgi:molybdate transport system permease protein